MKVVLNSCYGGFGLSDEAYEKLNEWGIPIQAYISPERNPDTGLYILKLEDEGEVIFDNTLSKDSVCCGRYWDSWTRDKESRSHPLVVRVVEELGERANGVHAKLRIADIPDDIEWKIDEYDGIEHIAESHRTW